MSIGRSELAGLIGKIISALPEEREEGAENVCDWSQSFDLLEARIVVRILSVVAHSEKNATVREAQLNAVAEIFSPRSMSRDDVAPVLEIPLPNLDPSEISYIQGIGDSLGGIEGSPS
ncbi:hypothetical protein ACFWJM_18965 [Streptomyces sp. NPDC127077]|uniref:hypothetical protein n=1 Tax=Streptomyces sp. NPDC127077 TaxID=3347131 RepID=UPI0036644987